MALTEFSKRRAVIEELKTSKVKLMEAIDHLVAAAAQSPKMHVLVDMQTRMRRFGMSEKQRDYAVSIIETELMVQLMAALEGEPAAGPGMTSAVRRPPEPSLTTRHPNYGLFG